MSWPVWQPPPAAILIDVGFTLTFCDGGRIAALAASADIAAEPAALDAALPRLHRELAGFPWPSTAVPTETMRQAPSGARFFRRLFELAGTPGPDAALDAAALAVWHGHLQRNVWCRPGPGVAEALAALHAAGYKLALVSNSEGTIGRLMHELGWSRLLGAICDSWEVGVAKPDPRIFTLALERLGARPEDALMVGDSLAADVAGARAAGLRAALIDAQDLHGAADVPRFRDFPAFAASLLAGGSGGRP